MRFADMLRMSASNLWKRKVRTILTILGVVIGTASIVVMISIGLGLDRAVLEDMANYGSMTTITVMPNPGSQSQDDPTRSFLSEDAVAFVRSLKHVEAVSPVLSCSGLLFTGKYYSYINMQGMTLDVLSSLDIPFGEGGLPEEGDELKLVLGNLLITDLSEVKSGRNPYWENGNLPNVNFMEDQVKIIFDPSAYWTYIGDTTGQSPKPKKYGVSVAGVVAGGPEDHSQYGYSTYVDIEALKSMLQKVYKGKPIPGQPVSKSNKPYKEFYYNSLYVCVDDMNNVIEVQDAIASQGYQTNSNMEWVEYSQKQYAYIEAVLGGIGAVAMLVAAISITNTMMMSIYERTKEIGIMKVLGCNMRNIQTMFLFEAAFIGLIGGVVGTGFSYIVSIVMNKLSAGGSFMGVSTGMSYIPWWLSLLGVGFSVGISTLAGFFPSLRAMRLSPLAAIRND